MITINKLIANSIVITRGSEPGPGPEPVPTAPDGKVLYRTTAGGEWLEDDAVVSSGEFYGFMYADNTTAVEVIIPSKDSSGNDVTSILARAFSSCTGLTSVTIPNSVTSIGYDAFYGCTSVNDVYCYPNPTNLTWNEGGKDDFKRDGSTLCHVKAEYLSAYQSNFTGIVNVTFVGDLT